MSYLHCGNLSISPVLTDLELRNSSVDIEHLLTGRDASWILTSSVIIFTMQTGFGLLESGCVNSKNEVNIMVKNALDVVFGGITYWAFGFGLSFGADYGTNPFVGVGCFLLDASNSKMGFIYAVFIFQLSFATTSTTIVSGAMAERTRLRSYIVFSMLNTVIYSIPAHWLWATGGFLEQLGCIDVAGCGPVHLIGGATGLIATVMLGPRSHMKNKVHKETLPSPMKSLLGTFMLWWGWIRFNSGSVFIISSDAQWELAVRGAVNTIVGSMAGGVMGVILSIIWSYKFERPRYDVGMFITGLLGSLVSVTGICTVCRPWESLVIGTIAAILASLAEVVTLFVKIDDPVGVIPVHLVSGIWGLLAVGIFLDERYSIIPGTGGVLKTGNWYLLGVQSLAVIVLMVWTITTSYVLLKVIDLSIGLRLSAEDELRGSDVVEHGVQNDMYSRSMGDQVHDHEMYDTIVPTNTDKREENGIHHNVDDTVSYVDFFQEFLIKCKRNELQIVLRPRGSEGITLELNNTFSNSPSNLRRRRNSDQNQQSSVEISTITTDSAIETHL